MYEVIDERLGLVSSHDRKEDAVDAAENLSRHSLRWSRRPFSSGLHGDADVVRVFRSGVVVHTANASF